jgi:hypothetical protein
MDNQNEHEVGSTTLSSSASQGPSLKDHACRTSCDGQAAVRCLTGLLIILSRERGRRSAPETVGLPNIFTGLAGSRPFCIADRRIFGSDMDVDSSVSSSSSISVNASWGLEFLPALCGRERPTAIARFLFRVLGQHFSIRCNFIGVIPVMFLILIRSVRA